MKKIIFLIISFLMFSATITVRADVSSTANNLEFFLKGRDNSNYHAPYVSEDGSNYVDRVTGAFVAKETDLILPGKNGLDVNITRLFSSHATEAGEPFFDNNYSSELITIYAYPYSTVINGQISTTYVVVGNDVPDIMYIDYTFNPRDYSRVSTNNGEVYYIPYNITSGQVVYERNTTLPRLTVRFTRYIENRIKDYSYGDQKLGYGWEFNLPELWMGDENYNVYCKVCKKQVPNFSLFGNLAIERDDNGVIIRHGTSDFNSINDYSIYIEQTGTFRDDNGNSFVVENYTTNATIGTNAEYSSVRGSKEYSFVTLGLGKFNYNEVYEDGSFSYKYIIKHKSGKSYYFNSAGQIRAIIDKYGNKIQYQHSGSTTTITDTYGRIITISGTPRQVWEITVTDGDLVKKIVYEFKRVNNPSDAIGHFDTDDKYYLRVYKNEEGTDEDATSTSNVTVYTMSANLYCSSWWNNLAYNYRVDKITYPSGLVRNYSYFFRDKHTQVKYNNIRDNNFYPVPTVGNYTEISNGISATYTFGYSDNRINLTNREYWSTTTNSINGVTQSTNYNVNGQLYQRKQSNGSNYYILQSYGYKDSNRSSPVTSHTITQQNGSSSTTPVYTLNYTYDDKYNMMTENDGIYSATYTYDSDYSMPLTKIYTRDTGKVVKIANTLTSNKKSIAQTNTYENDVLKSSVSYDYDVYGNVSEMLMSPDGTEEYLITYDYTYGTGDLTVTSTYNDVKDNVGIETNFSTEAYYNFFGNLTSASNTRGNTTEMVYDMVGRMTNQYNPDLTEKEIVYDTANNRLVATDERGTQMRYSYNQRGQIAKVEIYDTGWKELEIYIYDGIGRQTGFTQTRGYNGTSPTERYTQTTAYDWQNRPTTITVKNINNATVAVMTYTYTLDKDTNNKPIYKVSSKLTGDSNINPATHMKTTDYRNLVTEETQTDPNNTANILQTAYTYDIMGNVKTVKTPRAFNEGWTVNTAVYNYDYMGNVVSETNPEGQMKTYTYDRLGRLKTVSDILANKTVYYYDAMNHHIKTESDFSGANKSVMELYYADGTKNVTKQRVKSNAVGSTLAWDEITYQYNNRELPVQVVAKRSADTTVYTQYAYDAGGNPLRVYTGQAVPVSTELTANLPAECSLVQYGYNLMGNLSTITHPDGTTEGSVYDYAGNLKEKTGRDGVVSTYVYNVFAKPVTETKVMAGETQTTSYAYNAAGLVTGIQRGSTSEAYTYDNFGRMTSETIDGISKSYNYDKHGNVTRLNIYNGTTLIGRTDYTYTKADALWQVTSGGATTTYSYATNGFLSGIASAARTVSYTRNNAGLVTDMSTTISGNTTQYNYDYYLNGNIKQETETNANSVVKTKAYVYDGLGQLTSETTPDYTASYTYDLRGNRVSKQSGNTTTSYNFDLSNKLLQTVETTGETSNIVDYNYDPSGRLYSKMHSSITPASGSFAISLGTDLGDNEFFTYDINGRLAKYETGGTVSEYRYDLSGLRIGKIVNSMKTNFVNDRGSVVLEMNSSKTVTKTYTRGLELLYATDNAGINTHYAYNAHGDVTYTYAGNGTERIYQYDAFGNEVNPDSADTNPFRYCGEYTDLETNNIYLRARYYDPSVGRFLSADTNWNTGNMIYGDPQNKNKPVPDVTAIIQSSNLYVYAMNNPIRWIDPSGKIVTEWDIAVLPTKFVDRLQWITDNWESGTEAQQKEWRAEAEGYRAMYRNDYEYTDDSGITRSTETGGEIKFCYYNDRLGTSTLFIKAGYSLNGQDKVTLNSKGYRLSAYIIDGGINANYHTDKQRITTNGTYIFYYVEYSLTMTYTVPIFGGEWSRTTSGGEVEGWINPGNPITHIKP